MRVQSSDRNKAEKKMLAVHGELREVTVFEDIFQDPLATMSWNNVILVAEHPSNESCRDTMRTCQPAKTSLQLPQPRRVLML
jgi:hypothetical protein